MLPEATFIQVADADSDNSLESMIVDCQNLSTAFHPQTNGLSERKNQWIEQYLRLITTNQEDWSDWLAVTTLIHNNLANSTTSFAPNELLIGWEPLMTIE